MVLAIHHYRNPTLWENGGIAQYMYEGKGFWADFFGLTAAPTSLQEPGYVVLLWAVWKLFGQTPRLPGAKCDAMRGSRLDGLADG